MSADTLTRLVIPGIAASKGNSYRIAKRRDGTPTLVRGHRHGKGNPTKDFETETLRVMLEQRVQPIVGPVSVEAVVYPPDMRRDVPGCEKVLLDALQNWRRVKGKRVANAGNYGCYANDAQVHRFLVELGYVDKANPRVEVTIRPLRAA